MAWGWAGYQITASRPGASTSCNLNLNAWRGYNFGGAPVFIGGNVNFWGQFKNYWSVKLGINRQGTGLSQGALRGGPYLRSTAGWNAWFGAGTDARQRLTWKAAAGGTSPTMVAGATAETIWPWSTARATGCRSRWRRDTRTTRASCCTSTRVDAGGGSRYVMGRVTQNTVYLTLRLNYSVTPELSIQFYGQPFISNGRYDSFKRIADPRAALFQDRSHIYGGDEIAFDAGGNEYRVREAGGAAPTRSPTPTSTCSSCAPTWSCAGNTARAPRYTWSGARDAPTTPAAGTSRFRRGSTT